MPIGFRIELLDRLRRISFKDEFFFGKPLGGEIDVAKMDVSDIASPEKFIPFCISFSSRSLDSSLFLCRSREFFIAAGLEASLIKNNQVPFVCIRISATCPPTLIT